jgi:hypothetical protein
VRGLTLGDRRKRKWSLLRRHATVVGELLLLQLTLQGLVLLVSAMDERFLQVFCCEEKNSIKLLGINKSEISHKLHSYVSEVAMFLSIILKIL